MSRVVLPLVVAVIFAADVYTSSLGHALTWLFGIVTGLALACAVRDDV